MSAPAEQMDADTPYFQLGLRRSTQALFPDTPPTPMAGGGGGEAPSGPMSFGQTLAAATQAGGKPLGDEEIQALRNEYVDKHVVPGLWGQKGMSQGKFDALKTVFDNNSERTIAKYKASLTGEAAGGEAPVEGYDKGASVGRFVRGVADTAATTATAAIGGTLGGVLHMADYGVRGGNELINRMRGDKSGNGWSEQSIFGRGGDAVDAVTEGVDQALVSDESLRARKEFGELLSRDAPGDEITAFIAKHPAALTGMLGQTLGFLTPALATKIPKIASGLKTLSEGGRLARAAGKAAPIALTGVPGVGQAGAGHEQRVMNAPLAELLTTPEAKTTYALMASMGLSEAAFRRKMAAEGLGTVLATSAIANLALPGLNPRLLPTAYLLR